MGYATSPKVGLMRLIPVDMMRQPTSGSRACRGSADISNSATFIARWRSVRPIPARIYTLERAQRIPASLVDLVWTMNVRRHRSALCADARLPFQRRRRGDLGRFIAAITDPVLGRLEPHPDRRRNTARSARR
jgi:hypothetical protein